jgi:Family of unknown function (DUF6266)
MAKLNRLPFILSGKIGDHVYYRFRDKQLVRKMPSPRKSLPSDLETQNRSRFAFMIKFLRPLKNLFDTSFQSGTMGSLTRALSINLKHVIPGSYPDWKVDFSKLLLSKGEITGAGELQVSAHKSGQLHFRWEARNRRGRGGGDDLVYVAVYCEELKKWLTDEGSVQRKDGFFILDAKPFIGFRVHVYFGLVSSQWRSSSNSQYLGEVEIV